MKINKIVSDISKNLNNETSFETNQESLGIRSMLRGIAMKIQIGNNFDTSEDRKYKKIIVKESASFVNEFWVERCKAVHEEEEPKKRLSQCHGNFLNDMMNGESEERRHVERTKLDTDRAPNESIRSWMLGQFK